MDFVKDTVGKKMGKDAQPGNQVEGRADNAANQGTRYHAWHLPFFQHLTRR